MCLHLLQAHLRSLPLIGSRPVTRRIAGRDRSKLEHRPVWLVPSTRTSIARTPPCLAETTLLGIVSPRVAWDRFPLVRSHLRSLVSLIAFHSRSHGAC